MYHEMSLDPIHISIMILLCLLKKTSLQDMIALVKGITYDVERFVKVLFDS